MRARQKTLVINSKMAWNRFYFVEKNGTPLTFSQRKLLSNDYISDRVVLIRLDQKKLTLCQEKYFWEDFNLEKIIP